MGKNESGGPYSSNVIFFFFLSPPITHPGRVNIVPLAYGLPGINKYLHLPYFPTSLLPPLF